VSARKRAALLLPSVLALLLYARAAGNGFAFDDKTDLLENRLVTGPLEIGRIFTTEYYGGWGHMASGHYRPLLNMTYKLVAALFGLRPIAYHILNAALFAAIVALSVSIAARLSRRWDVALAAGLVFAAHPINSESVAAIAGLKELGAAGLGLLSLWLYIRARETSGFVATVLPVGLSAGLFFSLLAALMFKETAIAFLPVVLASEFLHAGAPRMAGARDAARRMFLAWPLAGALVAGISFRALVTGGLFHPTAVFSVDNPLVLVPDPARRVAAFSLLARYIKLYLWPACLSSDYSEGSFSLAVSASDPWLLVSLLAALALAGLLAWALAKGFRTTAFGVLAFAFSYCLVSNVIVLIGTNMAERLFFVPSWALSITVASLLVPAAGAGSRLPKPRAWKTIGASLLAVLVAALAARTWVRIGDWRSNRYLMDSVLKCYPRNVKALIVKADAEARAGYQGLARQFYDEALGVRPDSSYALAGLGTYLADRGEDGAAERLLLACARSSEPIPGAVLSLGLMYLKGQRYEEALWAADRTLQARPGFGDAATARVVRGEVFLARGEVAAAQKEYRLALEEDPENSAAHYNLGRCLEALDDWEGALKEYKATERLAPGDEDALYARAQAEARLGRLEQALQTTERLKALHPDFIPGRKLWTDLTRPKER